jgi:hypothetical protein
VNRGHCRCRNAATQVGSSAAGNRCSVPLMPHVFTRLRRCHNASSMAVGAERVRIPTINTAPDATCACTPRAGRPRPPGRAPDPAGADGPAGGPWPAQESSRAQGHHNIGCRLFQFRASGG